MIDIIAGPARKAWRVALIEEGGHHLVELRLAARAPDGSITLTDHRSVLRPETLRGMIDALLAAEIGLEVSSPILMPVGSA